MHLISPTIAEIQNKSILQISTLFWEKAPRDAFYTCYAAMRKIDDCADAIKATSKTVSNQTRKNAVEEIRAWNLEGNSSDYPELPIVRTIFNEYNIPTQVWTQWLQSMIYDIYHDEFATFRSFVQYAEGVAIAPGMLYLYLLKPVSMPSHCMFYENPLYQLARPLALFSYLIHIIRDFQEDQQNHINNFPQDLLRHHGLTHDHLRQIAHQKGDVDRFRALVQQYCHYACYYRTRAIHQLNARSTIMDTMCHFCINLVLDLYRQIQELIDVEAGWFTTQELTPCPSAIQQRIQTYCARWNTQYQLG
jgi:phytoene/squalene synthetase